MACSSAEEEKELVVSLEQCIGQIGKCLGRDIQKSVKHTTALCPPSILILL